MEQITELISTVGFPIFVCIAMGYFIITMQKQHKEETDKMTEAINNNSKLLEKILEHMRDELLQ